MEETMPAPDRQAADVAMGIVVDDADGEPDYDALARRGTRVYQFAIAWDAVVTAHTFHHNEPAVEPPEACDDSWHGGAVDVDPDAAVHQSIHADAWDGLVRVRIVVDRERMASYHGLMTNLRARGIEPMPVLDPWLAPQTLRNAVGGWTSPLAIEAYAEYARTCFAYLGHLASSWVAFVGPHVDVVSALGRAEIGVDPSIVQRALHNILLGHARAASIYHDEFAHAAPGGRGRIGAALECAPRPDGTDPHFDRFVEPLRSGRYAVEGGDSTMTFTPSQSWLLKRSTDMVVLDCMCPPLPSSPDKEARAMRQATLAMASSIDRAAAALPGVALYVADESDRRDGERWAVACLSARIAIARKASRVGRPVVGYLVYLRSDD